MSERVINMLGSEVDRLRGLLAKYGNHDTECAVTVDGPCDCGWEACPENPENQ